MTQSKAVRDRKNRRDTSQRLNEAFLGAMVSATAYNGDVRMIDVMPAVPGSASMAGKMAGGLIPTED